MKTTTLKKLIVTIALAIFVLQVSAQSIGTRIDVQSTNFSDKVWIFTNPICTHGFDNGWDGYKMVASVYSPQIYADEAGEHFQVDAIPDVNNTLIGFQPSSDTLYTLTFTHQNLALKYQQLFLIDSIANKTIDIYTSGTKYTFIAKNRTPINRFKIVTSVVIPPVTTIPVDTVVSPVIPPDTIVTPPVVPPTPPVPPTTVDPKHPNDKKDFKNENTKDSKNKKEQIKKLKIYSSEKSIYIENPGKQKGKLKLCHAVTGRIVKSAEFNALGTSIINTNLASGTYVVSCVTESEIVSTIIIIR